MKNSMRSRKNYWSYCKVVICLIDADWQLFLCSWLWIRYRYGNAFRVLFLPVYQILVLLHLRNYLTRVMWVHPKHLQQILFRWGILRQLSKTAVLPLLSRTTYRTCCLCDWLSTESNGNFGEDFKWVNFSSVNRWIRWRV